MEFLAELPSKHILLMRMMEHKMSHPDTTVTEAENIANNIKEKLVLCKREHYHYLGLFLFCSHSARLKTFIKLKYCQPLITVSYKCIDL